MERNLEALAKGWTAPSPLWEAPAPPSLLTQLLDALKRLGKQHRDRRLLSHLDARTLKDIGVSREIYGGQLRYAQRLDAR